VLRPDRWWRAVVWRETQTARHLARENTPGDLF